MDAQTNLNYTFASRSNQTKRQREWVYLSHYLAITGLYPSYIISGLDDGREPDFTLVFNRDARSYFVGVELTTLPRLRDQMGDKRLVAKRWYWQSLLAVAEYRHVADLVIESNDVSDDVSDDVIDSNSVIDSKNDERLNSKLKGNRQLNKAFSRFKVPVHTVYMPASEFNRKYQGLPLSVISQADVDAVMAKKSRKVAGYSARRPLNELWLLIHTDKFQPNSILASPKHPDKSEAKMIGKLPNRSNKPIASKMLDKSLNSTLTHTSGFDQVHISRYPSHKLLNVRHKHL